MANDQSPDDFEQVFDTLVRTHYERLANFAYHYLKSDVAAEDAVQEVLFKAWRHREGIRMHDPLPYLYSAVRNECLMTLRHRKRWVMTGLDDGRPDPAVANQFDAISADLAAAVGRAIESLPKRCRLVFVMSREQDLTYAEIARILGLSVKTVENHIGRALKTLRDHLAPYLSCILALVAAAVR